MRTIRTRYHIVELKNATLEIEWYVDGSANAWVPCLQGYTLTISVPELHIEQNITESLSDANKARLNEYCDQIIADLLTEQLDNQGEDRYENF
jgi:hypothetical protein